MFEQGCEAISSLAGRVLYVLGQPEDGLALHLVPYLPDAGLHLSLS